MEDAPVTGFEGKRIAVVGGGVVGMTTAVRAQRRLAGASVTLLAAQLSPHTTGDGAAGVWQPHLLGDTPPHLIQRWAVETYRHLLSLWKDPEAPDNGVSLLPLVCVTRDAPPPPPPAWGQHVLGFQVLQPDEIMALRTEHGREYTAGFRMLTLTAEPSRWLPRLQQEFQRLGGEVRCPHTVHSLRDLEPHFDAVVNCTGLGAAKLTGDPAVRPIRGQVARVYAPWIKHVFSDETKGANYIIPNMDSVVLGGTSQDDDWDCRPRREDAAHILGGCERMLPSLSHARVLTQWVGLRPARTTVRLDTDQLPGSALKVVHNYGHGGSGVTLSWGCAGHAVDLLQQVLTHARL